MGRRRFYRPPDTRSSLGDGHVQEACAVLSRNAQRTVNAMTKYEFSREQTLPMLFRDDDIAKMQAVNGMVDAARDNIPYKLAEACYLWIDYERANLPAIEQSRLFVQPERIGPLLNHIAAVRDIHLRFEAVKYVLRWFNREATPGAIRYYWPTAMQLCPKATCWDDLQEVPTRFKEPEGIGKRMQMIRDSATTVATSLLLPAHVAPKNKDKLWLTFESYQPTQGDLGWTTDVAVYHL